MSETCRNAVIRRSKMSCFRGFGEMIGGGVDGRRAWRERGGGVLAATEQGGGWVGRRRQRSDWRDFQHLPTALRHPPTANARERENTPGLDWSEKRIPARRLPCSRCYACSAGWGRLHGSKLISAGHGGGLPHRRLERSRSPRATGPPVPARRRPCNRA